MTRKKKPGPHAQLIGLPSDYADFLESLKARVRQAQTKAMLSVNRELIQLYWDIGRGIALRQEQEGWGRRVVDRLAGDLQKAFPGVGGFSASNVSRMRAFYRAYRPPAISAQAVPKLATSRVAQPVRQVTEDLPPSCLVDIPWGHNVVLLFKLSSREQRLWYAAKTLEHGWSRAVLTLQIESDLFGRQGKAVTNFTARLPASQSDLKKFTPEDAGKMNFYLSAVDSKLNHSTDAPAIGLILCKMRDRITAEYALRDINKPIGVAEWQTKLVHSLPEPLKGELPSIEEIEAELGTSVTE